MILVSKLNDSLLLPYQLLLDMGYQVSSELYASLITSAFEDYFEVKTANDWINLEAFGHMTAYRADHLARQLFTYCETQNIKTLELYIDLGQMPINTDNLYSILFLSDQFKEIHLFINAIDYKNVESGLEKVFQDRSNIRVSSCDLLPENPADTNKQLLTELAQQRYKQLHKSGFQFKPADNMVGFEAEKVLDCAVGFAWTLLKLGGYEIASRVLSDLFEHAGLPEVDKEHLLMHLQLIRFHSHQYEAVTWAEYPRTFEHLEKQSVDYLHYIKAYSATLARHPEVAGAAFEAAGIHKDMPIEGEFNLYQLNIFALYNVITKNDDIAYALEMQIERYAQENNIHSLGLRYVNNINIARLYKKQRNFSLSHAYYEKAYDEISGGGYTASDYIYYNMNLGSLCEAAGDAKTALMHWVKAATHWLVSDNPYSMAWRPKIILCGEKTATLNQPFSLSQATNFLTNKINTLLKENQLDVQNQSLLNFARNEGKIEQGSAFLTDNLIVYATDKKAKLIHPLMQPLQQLLSNVFREILSIEDTYSTMMIDYLSENILRASKAFWPLNLVHRCENWMVNNEAISSEAIKTLIEANNCVITFSPLIENIVKEDEAYFIKYKRSFMNKLIADPNAIEIIAKCQDQGSLQLNEMEHLPDLWTRLLYQNILTFSFQKVH